ncbi:MAG TPA: PKD domain-containing protein, partial [Thermoplasmata archaeon]|nr:PKD domain-containing protein [Thermoplasmata archaeon]
FPIYAVGCYPWNFTQWVPTGGAAVSPTLADRTETLIVSGNGSLNAVWEYVRPTDTIHVATNPTVCGAVVLDGTPYSNGATVGLLDGLNHTLGASTCGSSLFAGYTFVGNFSILGTVFVPGGNGTLTANFAPSSSAVALQFFTEPSTCGGVLYRGAGYTNGESLSVVPGTYAISGGPCAHFGFLQWQLSGGVSISNNNLTVTSAGSVTEVNYHLTEVTFNLNPSSCGYALFDGVAYHNRQVASVTNNTTHTIYAINNSGCYLIAMTATGGLTLEGNVLVANGSGSVDISFAVGNPSNTIAFLTNPANCGAIWFNNNPYFNANFTSVAPGIVVTIRATPCAGYGFVRWLTFGPISIIGNTAWINSSGAIEAVFTPLVPLFLNTEPSTCGAIVFAGQTYPSNSTLLVAEQATYSLGSAPCAGYTLGAWSNSSGLLLTPGFVYVAGGGVLTAVFIPLVYPVLVLTLPSACGSVLVNGVRAFNGTVLRLSAGNYPVTPQPCLGDHLDHWNLTGNLSVAGNSLTVGGPGNLTAVYLPVPPVVVLSVAPSTLVGEEIEIFATIQVPVPPFNYSYAWDFGDGSAVVTTPANFTGHTYHSTGSFTVRVTVTDPYGRVANATAPLSVQPVGATQSVVLTTLQVAAIGAVAAVLLLVFLISYLRTRAARSTESSAGDGASGEGYSPSGTGRKHDKQ